MKYLPEILSCIWLCFYVYMKYRVVDVTLGRYQINAQLFLLLDVLTIPTYVCCSGQFIRRLSRKLFKCSTLFWAIGALLSFLIPYGYLFIAGKDRFPPSVWGALTLFVGMALWFFFLRSRAKLKE